MHMKLMLHNIKLTVVIWSKLGPNFKQCYNNNNNNNEDDDDNNNNNTINNS